MTPSRIVCPLGGDERAERALPSAVDVADLTDAPLELFSIVEDPHIVARQRSHLEGVRAGLDPVGGLLPSIDVVVDPHAPRALAARAGSSDTMMVMATSSQPLLHAGYLGSAAERTTREAHNPVLLVGPHNEVRLRDVERVVVPCDGSHLSEAALPAARRWADLLDVDLWVVSSIDPGAARGSRGPDPDGEARYVRRIATELGASWEVVHGADVAKSIVQWAGPALIAMTTHGRSGLSRIALGSVTTAVVRWASGPVLVANSMHGRG